MAETRGRAGDVLDVERAIARLDRAAPRREAGRVVEVTGLVVRATVPGIRVGELVHIEAAAAVAGGDAAGARVEAEVVGFRGDEAVLMPLGELAGIGPDALVITTGRPLSVGVAPGLLGRVLDGLGRPIDGLGPIDGVVPWPVDRPAPYRLKRAPVTRPLPLGVRAIDALLTVGEGQRLGLFAGLGRRQVDAARPDRAPDRGGRQRHRPRGRARPRGSRVPVGRAWARSRARSVVVCATSDAPSLVRLRSAFVATAIAEWFRAQGRRVLFLMDSLTRVARAQREVGLAAGEPPARQGYPPSVFALLPRLLERTGTDDRGSITALYTVLVAGGDMEEPIADEVRGILDGHVVLSRELASRGHWPAIDVLPSLSRLMSTVAAAPERAAAARVRAWLAAYERHRDLIVLGAYERGSDAATDAAIARLPALNAFLCQSTDEAAPFAETRRRLLELAGA